VKKRLFCCLIILLFVTCVSSGCTSDDNESKTVQIPVDGIYEIEIKSKVDSTVQWNWNSDRRLGFAIADSPNGYIHGSVSTSDDGSFVSKTDGKYVFQWENTNDFKVELTYEIQYEKQ